MANHLTEGAHLLPVDALYRAPSETGRLMDNMTRSPGRRRMGGRKVPQATTILLCRVSAGAIRPQGKGNCPQTQTRFILEGRRGLPQLDRFDLVV